MSKRTVFTTITPLPAGVTRDVVLETLHNHVEMIDLNPLVIERHICPPPRDANAEEFHCTWYSLTDRVSYLPGINGKVTYNACFHDLAKGVQTHVYAPLGLDIKEKWSVGGSLPGEPAEPVELGLGVPKQGLYLREDCDMRCNIMLTKFVRGTLTKAHSVLVDRLVEKAGLEQVKVNNQRISVASSDPASLHSNDVSTATGFPTSPTLSSSGTFTSETASFDHAAPSIQSTPAPPPCSQQPPQYSELPKYAELPGPLQPSLAAQQQQQKQQQSAPHQPSAPHLPDVEKPKMEPFPAYADGNFVPEPLNPRKQRHSYMAYQPAQAHAATNNRYSAYRPPPPQHGYSAYRPANAQPQHLSAHQQHSAHSRSQSAGSVPHIAVSSPAELEG